MYKKRKYDLKPYSCDYKGCNFKCSNSYGLVTHKRTHTRVFKPTGTYSNQKWHP